MNVTAAYSLDFARVSLPIETPNEKKSYKMLQCKDRNISKSRRALGANPSGTTSINSGIRNDQSGMVRL